MNIRAWMNENQNLVAVIAVVIMVLALFFIFYQCQGRTTPTGSGNAYYYDVATGETFTDEATLIPPITSPAGNEAVRAHYYTCGDCGEDERFVGYFEKYTPEAKQRIESAQQNEEFSEYYYEMEGQGLLISLDAQQWYPIYSPQGEQLMSDKLNCPSGQRLKYCHPK